MEMSFLNFIRATYFRGILPAVSSRKELLLRVELGILALTVSMMFFWDNLNLGAMVSVVFMLPVIFDCAQRGSPSVWRLYPLSPKKKTLYEFFGSVLACVMGAVAVMLWLALYGLALSLFTFAVTGRQSLLFVFSSSPYYNMTLAPFTRGNLCGWLFGIALTVAVFGGAKLFCVIRGNKKYIFLGLFLLLYIVFLLAMRYASNPYAPADSQGLFFTIGYLPYNMLYSAVCFVVGLVFTGVALVITYRSAK